MDFRPPKTITVSTIQVLEEGRGYCILLPVWLLKEETMHVVQNEFDQFSMTFRSPNTLSISSI
jgi:hypothetical protein